MEDVLEGPTRLRVPAHNSGKGDRTPGERAAGSPFYNPGMALNRDLAVLLVAHEARGRPRGLDVADALAGTGARSVRLASECGPGVRVHANDAMPAAVAALRANAQAAGVAAHVAVHEGDAHAFLAARRFDVVDLDPCGSPMPFLDAAMRATRHHGLLLVTATDTGALAGTFPAALRRRYDARHHLHAWPWRSEVGLRVLAGAIVRSAARFERAARPVLGVAWGHWMRVVVRVTDGKGRADAALDALGEAWADERGHGVVGRRAPAGMPSAGPLWTGPLHDAATAAALEAEARKRPLARPQELGRLLTVLAEEAPAPPFFLDPDHHQRAFGNPPRRDDLVERLQALGRTATRAHLDPKGVRTDATLEDLRTAWRA